MLIILLTYSALVMPWVVVCKLSIPWSDSSYSIGAVWSGYTGCADAGPKDKHFPFFQSNNYEHVDLGSDNTHVTFSEGNMMFI